MFHATIDFGLIETDTQLEQNFDTLYIVVDGALIGA
jgi:hypothetical protein